MRKKVETHSLTPAIGVAELAADTINEEARTVQLRFYSGAAVLRIPMFDDPYELEFEVTKKAVRLGRLRSGAPLYDNHSKYAGIGAILGVVDEPLLEDGQAYATARFSKREEVEPIWQDVLDRILRSVSMGVQIYELKEVTEEGAKLKRFRATDWEPLEVSLVGIPADPDAQVLCLAEEKEAPCRITFRAEALADAQTRENHMDIKVRLLEECELGKRGETVEIDEKDFDEKLHLKVTDDADLDAAHDDDDVGSVSDGVRVAQAIHKDKGHAKHIRDLAAHYGMDSAWIDKHVKENTPIDCAITDAAEARAKRAPKIDPHIGFGDDFESLEWRRTQMEDALVARALKQAPPDSARQYANHGFADLALECLRLVGRGKNLDPRRDKALVFDQALALHTTSDFPYLLGNALNKALLPAYQAAAPTFRQIAAQRTFNDFRAHNFASVGDFPVPLEVNEHGEYQFGTISEGNEQVTAASYGRILGLSRKTLINDDLGAFADLATKAGRRVSDFENATFYTVCIKAGSGMGPTLTDTLTVFHATHANVTAGGALANTLLESAYALMMAQTSLDGLKLNTVPAFVLTPVASWGLARRLTTPTNPTQASEINTFAGIITPIADANLSGTRFYVLADPNILPNYIYGYLQGSAGPRTQVREGFYVDGIEFKLALDFGCGAIDYRGGATGAGA